VTDDATLKFGDKRKKSVIIAAQSIDQFGLVGTSECRFVHSPNRGTLIDALSVFNSNADRGVR